MTGAPSRIDFYVLSSGESRARMHFACRLNEKAWGLRHSIYNHTSSEADARLLDELLWTFRDGSFVPHEIEGPDASGQAPIRIGCDPAAAPDGDLLVNLGDEIPPFFDRFGRVVEIIDATSECRRKGRERFSLYRDSGFEPNTHKID